MTLKDIIAIKGKGELFRVLSKSPKGIIVEMLFFLITIPTTSRIAFALNLDENAINILKQ